MKKSKIAALAGAVCVAVIGTVSAVVHAAQTPSCSIQYVAYANDELIIKCAENPSELIVWGPSWTACSSRQTTDTLKAFTSIANGAFLSGKKLSVNYATDSTCPTATSVAYLKEF